MASLSDIADAELGPILVPTSMQGVYCLDITLDEEAKYEQKFEELVVEQGDYVESVDKAAKAGKPVPKRVDFAKKFSYLVAKTFVRAEDGSEFDELAAPNALGRVPALRLSKIVAAMDEVRSADLKKSGEETPASE